MPGLPVSGLYFQGTADFARPGQRQTPCKFGMTSPAPKRIVASGFGLDIRSRVAAFPSETATTATRVLRSGEVIGSSRGGSTINDQRVALTFAGNCGPPVPYSGHERIRANRLFSRREKPGKSPRSMEMGDLPRRPVERDKAIIGLFSHHGDGQPRRQRGPQGAFGKAVCLTAGPAVGLGPCRHPLTDNRPPIAICRNHDGDYSRSDAPQRPRSRVLSRFLAGAVGNPSYLPVHCAGPRC
jgi:hypothetical protein